MDSISYINGKGQKVKVELTNYSIYRMKQRYAKLYNSITNEEAKEQIITRFPHADRVYNLKLVERKRIVKHRGTTLYFRDRDFTYVVQDARLVTVEISRKNSRHLNKKEMKI